MPRRESSRKTLQGFILKHILALANDCHLPGVISVSYSVHFIVPCCTQRSVRCSTEDGSSASLAKCLCFSASPSSHSRSVFLFLLRDCVEFLREISPPRRGSSIATISASSRLPSSCRRAVCQVWSLILQRDGKRSAEYTEQRYRVACSLAHSPVEARGENEDLCETITRGGKIRSRRYHSDTDGYSCTNEKIYRREREREREKEILE